MNVLFSTFTHAGYMPPLALSDRQVIVGPHYETCEAGGRVASVNVPLGAYDLAQVVALLPADQTPDLVVVQTDAFENAKALNLAAVPGRKLLLVADTHHGEGAIGRVIDYARSQPFDRVAFIHDPHHLHWFVEAGFADARYIPNANVQDFGLPFAEARSPHIVFIGQVGPQHPRRRFMLETIRAAGLPLVWKTASPLDAARAYAGAQISVNCSLNGDLNMRVFETLAAGGFLVTDRLSTHAGLEAMFRPGEHYVDYGDEAELVDKLGFYLARPQMCLAIARAGQAAYRAAHTPEHRRREVLDHAFGAPVPAPQDARAVPGAPGFGENLPERVRLYEAMQSLCLERASLRAVVDSQACARVASDLADLRPLKISGDMARPPADWQLMVLDAEHVGATDLSGGDPRAMLALMHADRLTQADAARLAGRGFQSIGGRNWLLGRRPTSSPS